MFVSSLLLRTRTTESKDPLCIAHDVGLLVGSLGPWAASGYTVDYVLECTLDYILECSLEMQKAHPSSLAFKKIAKGNDWLLCCGMQGRHLSFSPRLPRVLCVTL